MTRAIIVSPRGDVQVDPFNTKGRFDSWLASIMYEGQLNYHTLEGISPFHSEMVTRYILDLSTGKNTAKGHKKGPRSYAHLTHIRYRLQMLFRLLEQNTEKLQMDFTEDDVMGIFTGMRAGTIMNQKRKPYLDVSTYAKGFCAFWRWYMRTQKRNNIFIPDIVESIDTSMDHKPKWYHFTFKQVEEMALIAPSFEYKVLVHFLFDSGIRAPKELQNVRAMDIVPIPDATHLLLEIRDETSKTFGRKIKLMICGELVQQYIKQKKLEPEDFLFTKNARVYNRIIGKLGHKVLGIGIPFYQHKHGWIEKTLIKNGITMYDFRHNSVCHYLPIYKSENQMKYRYGWTNAKMIHYYSEYIGMKDTISDDDMLTEATRTALEQQVSREQQKVALLQEQFQNEKKAMEERMVKLEAMVLQKWAGKPESPL